MLLKKFALWLFVAAQIFSLAKLTFQHIWPSTVFKSKCTSSLREKVTFFGSKYWTDAQMGVNIIVDLPPYKIDVAGIRHLPPGKCLKNLGILYISDFLLKHVRRK